MMRRFWRIGPGWAPLVVAVAGSLVIGTVGAVVVLRSGSNAGGTSSRDRATAGCAVTPPSTIRLSTGAVVTARGAGPFYFGPYESLPLEAIDFNKVPWAVSPRYDGPLVVRGEEIHSHATVTFAFFPPGVGTPPQESGVPVLMRRRDRAGNEFVYQPELDIAPGPPNSWRVEGHFWSFPHTGCYAITAKGDGFTEVTIVEVVPSSGYAD
jgi:hypothetical protein